MNEGSCRPAGHVEPDGLSGRGQGRVRQRQAERLADDLRRGRGAEELAAAARAGAGPAAQVGGFLQGDLAVGEACADGLNLAGVLAFCGRQRDAAGNQYARQIAHGCQGHHHRGQTLVAGGDAEHAPARVGKRSDQPAEDLGSIVAIRQAVHHTGRALRSAVARVGDKTGEWYAAGGPAVPPRPPS